MTKIAEALAQESRAIVITSAPGSASKPPLLSNARFPANAANPAGSRHHCDRGNAVLWQRLRRYGGITILLAFSAATTFMALVGLADNIIDAGSLLVVAMIGAPPLRCSFTVARKRMPELGSEIGRG
jgi:hypothetical protein